jgi:hypothetical protein
MWLTTSFVILMPLSALKLAIKYVNHVEQKFFVMIDLNALELPLHVLPRVRVFQSFTVLLDRSSMSYVQC